MHSPDPSQSQDVKPKITLLVTFQGRSIKFQLKRTMSLKKVLDSAATQLNMERASMRFVYDGVAIRGRDEETPQSLGMQDDDEIEVHLAQEGGAFFFVVT